MIEWEEWGAGDVWDMVDSMDIVDSELLLSS